MPAITADGQPYLSTQLAPAQPAAGLRQVQQQQQAELLQAKWGYRLAAAEQALAASNHPLVRPPGVLFACKQLSPGSVLPPQRLPRRLQWSIAGKPPQLLRDSPLPSARRVRFPYRDAVIGSFIAARQRGSRAQHASADSLPRRGQGTLAVGSPPASDEACSMNCI